MANFRVLLELTFFGLFLVQSTVYAQIFNQNKPTGLKSTTLSKGEVCVVPQKLKSLISNEASQSSKDQDFLCGIDFHNDPLIGVCPKTFSTNPAVEVYDVPNSSTKEDFELKICALDDKQRDANKIAKFKQSITCSYTPSILAYYQLSQLLDAGNVPSSVIRTIDKSEHIKIMTKGTTSRISGMWRLFANKYDLANDSKIFTQDGNQIYGALSINPGGETFYNEFYGPAHSYENGLNAFEQTKTFQQLQKPQPINTFIVNTLEKSAQAVQAMKDMSDLILMDTILSQQDRFGNVHYKLKYFYIDNNKVVTSSVKNIDPIKLATLNPILVKTLILKDNDCGVAKSNLMLMNNTLKKIHHMNPKTYENFMNLASVILNDEIRDYFMNELLFTKSDYTKISNNILTVKSILSEKCRSGELNLDLDLEALLGFKNIIKKCD